MTKFLIGQLGRFGDCLYATSVACQIKTDHPESHITWAVASRYKPIIENNPYVDAIWELPIADKDLYRDGWNVFEAEARMRKAKGEFDELVFTQFPDKYWIRFDGTIRSSILRGYDGKITVPVQPVVRLTAEEELGVETFAEEHKLSSFRNVILFECNPGSHQSFISLQYALKVAQQVVENHPDTCIILTSDLNQTFPSKQIINGASLNFKQNAALSRHCTLLIGGSSGITWLATSDAAKKLNTVQLLSRSFPLFAGVKYDHQKWGLSTDHIIEVTNSDPEYLLNCLVDILEGSFMEAKKKYDEVVEPTYDTFKWVLSTQLLRIRYITKIPSFVLRFHQQNRHLKLQKLLMITFMVTGSFLKRK